jgi:hypothetical protein
LPTRSLHSLLHRAGRTARGVWLILRAGIGPQWRALPWPAIRKGAHVAFDQVTAAQRERSKPRVDSVVESLYVSRTMPANIVVDTSVWRCSSMNLRNRR